MEFYENLQRCIGRKAEFQLPTGLNTTRVSGDAMLPKKVSIPNVMEFYYVKSFIF